MGRNGRGLDRLGVEVATRFADWTQGQARALLAFIALILLAAALLYKGSSEDPLPTSNAAPAQVIETDVAGPVPTDGEVRDKDLELYDVIIERVAAGENYYRVAIEEQKARDFPVIPGFAVRLPTLATISAAVGQTGVTVLAALLCLALFLAWWRRLSTLIERPARRIIALGLLFLGIAVSFKPTYFVLHELWAGMLLATALALHRPGQWRGACIAAALALSIREHALPFVLLMGAFALWRRDWREMVAWGVLAAGFVVMLAWHVTLVESLTSLGDPVSPSWLALRGPQGWIENMALSSGLYLIPTWLAGPLVFLPLLGWAALKDRLGIEALLLFAGYGLMFMIAGRENNFYWALMVAPAWFIGLYAVPYALRDLAKHAR